MINQFLNKINQFAQNEETENAFNLCREELIKMTGKAGEITHEDCHYIATIYNVMADMVDDEQALNCYDSAIAYVPNSADLYWNRAEAKIRLKDYQGAMDDYSIVIANAPSAEAYLKRAYFRLNLQDFNGAIEDNTSAINIAPNFEGGYYQRAYVKKITGDLKGAIADYEKAIEIKPNEPDFYGECSNIRIDMKDFEGALKDLKNLYKLSPDNTEVKEAIKQIQIRIAVGDQEGQYMLCTLKNGKEAIVLPNGETKELDSI